uniref:Uncharacterized protein n=1 Tax=Zea mays TaxID=4577 RepID=C0PKC0_MAIZE|nr:unknown [Zea mays]
MNRTKVHACMDACLAPCTPPTAGNLSIWVGRYMCGIQGARHAHKSEFDQTSLCTYLTLCLSLSHNCICNCARNEETGRPGEHKHVFRFGHAV